MSEHVVEQHVGPDLGSPSLAAAAGQRGRSTDKEGGAMKATALGLAFLFVGYLVPGPAFGLEPGNLLGNWIGEYRASSTAGGGTYTVTWTIAKIEGDDVEGVFNYGGTAKYHNRDLKFKGKLNGNVFTAERVPTVPGEPPANWSFTIAEDGKSMTGTFYATRSTTLTLNKGK